MEGNQNSDSGPANRLDVQVLEKSCYHRASRGYTSVQGPRRRLTMDAKSSLISQICFCSNIHVVSVEPISIWWLLLAHGTL